jgi:hypothetical protein
MDEGRLIARPEQIPVLRRRIPPALRSGNAQLEKARLWKLQQTCEHEWWAKETSEGPYKCDICFHKMYGFIKRCIVCHWPLCLSCLDRRNQTVWPLPELSRPNGCNN